MYTYAYTGIAFTEGPKRYEVIGFLGPQVTRGCSVCPAYWLKATG
jgi:hypothetical protein